MEPAAIVAAVTSSGLRGRGGAAFPAGIKWKTVLGVSADQKYIVCSADEGNSGTFSDRMIMEGDPFVLIEGMSTIAGIATGATRGYILRWEYPDAHAALKAAIAAAYAEHYLGENILGTTRRFRPGSAPGRGRLYLRRRDLAARVAGEQARPGAFQAAAACDPGAVRQADRDQQCDHPGFRTHHSSLSDAGQHVLEAEHLQQSQHLDELAFAAFGHARFDQPLQRGECGGCLPFGIHAIHFTTPSALRVELAELQLFLRKTRYRRDESDRGIARICEASVFYGANRVLDRVRLNAGKSAAFIAWPSRPPTFHRLLRTRCAIYRVETSQKRNPGSQSSGIGRMSINVFSLLPLSGNVVVSEG